MAKIGPLTRRQILKTTLLAGTLLASSPLARVAAAPLAAPTTWTVLLGAEGVIEPGPQHPSAAWEFMRFYPATITINEGDTIEFKANAHEPHTVTFLKPGQQPPDLIIPEGGNSQRLLGNPAAFFPSGGNTVDGTTFVNSGQMAMDDPNSAQSFKVTFPKAGSYDYLCLFHSMMRGKVEVQAAGSAYPKTQAQIDADTKALMDADTQMAMSEQQKAMQGSTSAGPNGTTVYHVNLGWGNGDMAWMRFGPKDIKIKVGDKVSWTQMDVETPHTVTFPTGSSIPDFILAEPQAGGPPKLVVNPVLAAPGGGATFAGGTFTNSGLIWGTKVPIPGSRTYELTFTKAGTYNYVCGIHYMAGMVGSVTVEAAPQPTGMPNTGEGGGDDEQDRRLLD